MGYRDRRTDRRPEELSGQLAAVINTINNMNSQFSNELGVF